MDLQFQEYRPRKLVNVHRHVDGPWFWTKYSAHPYVGKSVAAEMGKWLRANVTVS
ncbi:hypothetical protein L0337_44615 [candidate division KSB1 bacterium]|nr:hypothetical protein [candidate division KSB1 bacterium]